MNSKIRIRESEKCEAFLRRWLWVCEILMLLTIFTMYAVRNNPSVNFIAMNGTYQNYNPVRRLLNGQIPMQDFQDYLGMGHLYLGTFMTALFGGDYHASLYAFDFLTMLSTLLIFWAIGHSVLRDKTLTTTTTCLAFFLVITGCLSICEKVPLIGRMIGVLSKGLDAGNSARIIRGMILPIVLALLLLSDRFLPTVVKKAKIPDGFNRWLPAIVTGLIAGFAFVWSNDYGISCWVCLMIIMGWTSLSRFRRLGPAILDVLVELVASLVSLLVFVWLATQGNFMLWLQSIVGVGGYQRWYYNSDKAYYLFDLEYSKWILLQAAVCIAYMVALFRNRGSREVVIRYGVPALANMV